MYTSSNSSLCEELNIYMLIDIGHAKISTSSLNIPLYDYLQQLTLKKVKKLHLNKITIKDDFLHDNHSVMQEEDYKIFS